MYYLMHLIGDTWKKEIISNEIVYKLVALGMKFMHIKRGLINFSVIEVSGMKEN